LRKYKCLQITHTVDVAFSISVWKTVWRCNTKCPWSPYLICSKNNNSFARTHDKKRKYKNPRKDVKKTRGDFHAPRIRANQEQTRKRLRDRVMSENISNINPENKNASSLWFRLGAKMSGGVDPLIRSLGAGWGWFVGMFGQLRFWRLHNNRKQTKLRLTATGWQPDCSL
jgi:hypothetical protein